MPEFSIVIDQRATKYKYLVIQRRHRDDYWIVSARFMEAAPAEAYTDKCRAFHEQLQKEFHKEGGEPE